MMINPAAYFDTLSLEERTSQLVEGSSRAEVHLLAYGACLLSLYDGQPAADWEYEFASTDYGLPFSQDLNASIDLAVNLGHLVLNGGLMILTDEGRSEVVELRSLESYGSRDRYIAGAAECLLVLTPGNVREAFNYDPAISYLRKGNHRDWLLTESVVERLYSNFRQLREALEYEPRDLSIPMVSWLRYLIETGRAASH
jgi:hypothetical protein